MKTEEELQILKEKVEEINKELEELTEEELKIVTGGYRVYPESSRFGKFK